MISAEQRFFLQVLSDHIHNKKTPVREGLDKALFISVTKNQQCEGIAYYQTHMPELQPLFGADLYYAANRKELLRKIHEEFSDHQIPYLIFKGTEVAQLYPVPALRTMGDLDIMVHKPDKQKAHEILLSLGFANECLGPNEWIYYFGDMEFELHHRMMNDELVSLPEHKKFMNSVWDHVTTEDGVQYHINRDFHLVFLFLHLRKHFMNSGAGFRQFLDIAMTMKCGDIDWDYFNRTAEELRIAGFVKICFSFIDRWFGVKAGTDMEEQEEDFYQAATQQIFKNGVFGFDDAENKTNYPVIQSKHAGRDRIHYGVTRLFPSYEEMCARNYSFLNGKPWLLGIAWVYRWGRGICRLPSEIRKNQEETGEKVTKLQVEAREQYLSKWGLEI